MIRRASGVGVMSRPCRMNKGSSTSWRSRLSAWLMAGCDRFRRRLARVMLPSA